MFPWHQYLLAIIFIFGGFYHFRKPKLYEKIIPNYFPNKSSLVLASGIIEMVFGFMLITQESQKIGAIGILVLLIIFIPVHIHMLRNKEASLNLPKWILILRIPLQVALMCWSFLYIS